MEKTQPPLIAELDLGDTEDSPAPPAGKCAGTENPCHLRMIRVLMFRSKNREEIDILARTGDELELCRRTGEGGMNGGNWLEDLNRLLARFSGMGIGADIAAMTLIELWGLYCFLRRLAEA